MKDSSGVVKRPNAVEYFDFAWQDPTLVEPFKIKPGDELITRCYFNNKGSSAVEFGLGSDQEMCIDFIFYYPYLEANKNALAATQYCGYEAYGQFKKDTKLDLNDDGMRVFGINAGAADDPKCESAENGLWTPPLAPSPVSTGPATGGENGASARATWLRATVGALVAVISVALGAF